MPRAPRPSHAFTLTELIVVIGIAGLLIALLLPALARSRQLADAVKCSAVLHNAGQLLVSYSLDHAGYMPLAGNIAPGNDTNNPDDPATLGDVARRKYTYYDNGGGTICVTAMPAALAPYIQKKPARDDSWENVDADIQTAGPLQDAFLCPADSATAQRTYTAPRWINNYGSNTFLNGWSSYGVNAEVFAWTDAGIGGLAGHTRLRGKLAAIPHTEQTMLLADAYAAIEIWVQGANLSLADVYTGPETAGKDVFDLKRHQDRMNILFGDGHVDSRMILSSDGNPSDGIRSVSMDQDFR